MKKMITLCCIGTLLTASLMAEDTSGYRNDFYNTVNKEWLTTHTIKDDAASVSNFSLMSEHILAQSGQLIDMIKGKKERTQDEQNLLNFYDSYIDMDQRNALGVKPLKETLHQIDNIQNVQDLAKIFNLFLKKNVPMPLMFKILNDDKDSTRTIVGIGQSGISLPKKYYALKDETSKKQMEALKHFNQKLFTLAGYEHVEKRVKNALAVEQALANIQWSRIQMKDFKSMYNITPYSEVKKSVSHFDFDGMLKAQYLPTTATFSVAEPSYVKALNGLMTSIDIAKWKDYARMQYIQGKAGMLGQDFEKASDAYRKELGLGSKKSALEKKGLGVIQGTKMLFGKLYVEHFFDEKSKKQITDIVHNIQAAYKENIGESKRLSPSTKKAALHKLNAMTFNIAYPDKWEDYSTLKLRKDDLVGNAANLHDYALLRESKKLGKKVDRNAWDLAPQTMNAQNVLEINKFILLAAILQKPIFDANASETSHYGALGFIVAHEMGHAFDDAGSQYDFEGNVKNWWTPKDHKAFDVLKAKLIAQANAYEVMPGKFGNGQVEIGEIIADLSGAEIALAAYMKTKEAKAMPRKEALQTFFKQLAKTWRAKKRPQYMQLLLDSDSHPAEVFRTNGTLRNMDEFYEAFDVKKGDKMWLDPKERVKVW